MAFDQATRNKLQKFVSDARALLAEEFSRQMQNDYGMDPDTGAVSHIDSLPRLTDAQHQTAKLLRETVAHYQASSPGNDSKEILGRIVREQAFTVLNRLCALRMAEARGILIESIAKGYNSKGFQLYARVAGTSLGETGDTYRNYLFSVFDEFSINLAVLFDRYSPMGRLFPKETALLALLEKINDIELESLWAEDETLGWIYQYFNSKEERKKMRDESQAPRNSRELAVRNQFFTPRYVVEFLTDNTLGRIWYEMTKGKTVLKDQCRYLVRRPNEFFLEKGEKVPELKDNNADLSRKELLIQTVYIEHRSIKDPREILMFDPACGSMHFGLYAFDLFEKIYEEAWDLQSTGHWQGTDNEDIGLLTETYTTRDELLRDIPRLIIENNIHGVDIDPRAVQIAGLSLWLRAQRSWKEQNVKPASRPQIKKSKIVCAEPMPGEKEFLKAFSESLKPKVLGQLVEIIFEKMELAGEAGSLLKIEEEIEDAVDNAREEFNKELLRRKEEAGYLPGFAPKNQQRSLFDFADLPDKTQFWHTAEESILDALRNYAEQAEEEDGGRLRLFVEDAAKGFAFIDLCRKRYDAVLMNPPFGELSLNAEGYIKNEFKESSVDIYCSFIARAKDFIAQYGLSGAIIPRSFLYYVDFFKFRENIFFKDTKLIQCAELGLGVLDDATVRTFILNFSNRRKQEPERPTLYKNLTESNDWERDLLSFAALAKDNQNGIDCRNLSEFSELPGKPILMALSQRFVEYLVSAKKLDPIAGKFHRGSREGAAVIVNGLQTCDDFRFIRGKNEVPANTIHKTWHPLFKAIGYEPYEALMGLVVNWKNGGEEMKGYIASKGHSPSRYISSEAYYPTTGTWFPGICERGNGAATARFQGIPSRRGLVAVPQMNMTDNFLNGIMNSIVGCGVVGMIMPDRYRNPSYVGMIPIPESPDDRSGIENTVKNMRLEIRRFINDEYNTDFETNIILSIYKEANSLHEILKGIKKRVNSAIQVLIKLQNKLDIVAINALPISSRDVKTLTSFSNRPHITKWAFMGLRDNFNITGGFVHYCFGLPFGIWDICIVLGSRKKNLHLQRDGQKMPAATLGMLQNTEGLPAEPKDIPADYPLRITWSGIIVDDEGHPEDILTRIREAIEAIWKDKANYIEQEACDILGVRSLREYFGKPGKFFADHLKRYSKSRRQAPIYWPLSTSSGSYTLWLYYHRLTDQILYTCINNFVGPKLKQVSDDAEMLRKKSNRSSQEEKDLEKLSDLALELKDFQDELLRIAKFWKPNLNDGVQITAAPLWKLFQYNPWQTKLKQTWKDLEKGNYDWAHLAYSIWPERVIRASHKDHSYAIAHDLETDLWEEVETGTDKKGNPKTKWVPKDLSEKELKQLIAQKTGGNA